MSFRVLNTTHIPRQPFKMVQNKRFVLKQYADGFPKPGQDLDVEADSFDLDQAPPPGGLIVKNLYFSFDPYLRGKMRERKDAKMGNVSQSFQFGATIANWVVAKVLKSDSPKAKEGDIVATFAGAEEYSVVSKGALDRYDFYNIPDEKLPYSFYCGVLGMPGMTAYSSLYEIGAPKKGETIWISAASGPVGQIVGQLAKREGLHVIGSVGSDEKLDYILKEMKFDSGFNYKKEKPLDAIHRLAPDGVDIYYDNVGGEHLDAAYDALKPFGRISESKAAISLSYNFGLG